MTRSTGGSHALTTARQNLGNAPFSRTRPVSRSSGNSQADQRREHHMTDQHGRPWSCSVEIRSGMPTGLIANDFSAPWLPDQGALVVNPNNTSELWIDYRAMYQDRKQALGAYHKNAVGLATDKGWPIPTKGRYSADIIRILNTPPLPLEPVLAAAQENPWILGFTEVEDPRLVEFVRAAEDIDADLVDVDEDYGAEGYDAAVAGDEEAEANEGEPAAQSALRAAPVAFTPPAALDLDDFDDEDEDDAEVRKFAADIGRPADEANWPAGDASENLLSVLEDEHDGAALGGRTVRPEKTELVSRQAPRRPGSTSKRHKKGKSRGSRTMPSLRKASADRGGVPRTLADGAAPAVSSARIATERVVKHKSER